MHYSEKPPNLAIRMCFLGIDPGENGGAAAVDINGGYMGSVRWGRNKPPHILDWLGSLAVRVCYIEKIEIFRQMPRNVILNMQGLLVNAGMWHGFLLCLGIPYREVRPQEWQAYHQLKAWKRGRDRLKAIRQDNAEVQAVLDQAILEGTPLGKARRRWPDAPLPSLADDGVAVGLLLADMARKQAQELQQGAIAYEFRQGRKR